MSILLGLLRAAMILVIAVKAMLDRAIPNRHKNKTLISILFLLLPAPMRAQNTGAQAPLYANNGLPDFTVDASSLKDWDIVDRTFGTVFIPFPCELEEGTINALGTRRLLRFSVALMNRAGSVPTARWVYEADGGGHWEGPYAPLMVYDTCHGHYHFEGMTTYVLLDAASRVVVAGRKQAFCLMDVRQDRGGAAIGLFDCANQGVSQGWSDIYDRPLSGQWLDITGVPAGRYILRVTVNPFGYLNEGLNVYSNVLDIVVQIPKPTQRVPYLICRNDFYCE